jgi:hypothetical protein
MATKKTDRKRSGDGKGSGSGDPVQGGASPGASRKGTEERRSGYALKDDLVEQALITGEHRDLLENYFGEEAEGEEDAEPAALKLERSVGLAEAFLRAGVGNYVGTYWPVGDAAAEQFAGVFYKALLNGDSVGDALQQGRRKVIEIESVDWADYIHYGSPGFVVKRRT